MFELAAKTYVAFGYSTLRNWEALVLAALGSCRLMAAGRSSATTYILRKAAVVARGAGGDFTLAVAGSVIDAAKPRHVLSVAIADTGGDRCAGGRLRNGYGDRAR